MTGESAVSTLHACSILEKVATKGAAHDVVEGLLDKLVTILLDDLFFSLTNGTLSAKTNIEGPALIVLFDCE